MDFNLPKNMSSIIKVIGVGGGGSNAVNNMHQQGIEGVDFMVCNTDVQALEQSPVPNKIAIGKLQTEGLGAGSDPEAGKKSALENIDAIANVLSPHTKMVFITAGMGGGTGTGAAPVIAEKARSMGILTVGIVTTPFNFEGKRRMKIALEGIKELKKNVDTLIVINNSNILTVLGPNAPLDEGFAQADKVLCDAAKGIAEIITKPGQINVDFSDVKAIMSNGGSALMGNAIMNGEDRAIRAVEEALSSPLLDNIDITGAKGVLVNITSAKGSMTAREFSSIMEYINELVSEDCLTIIGTAYDSEMKDNISVTVIVTGFDDRLNDDSEKKRDSFSMNSINQPTINTRDPKKEMFSPYKSEASIEPFMSSSEESKSEESDLFIIKPTTNEGNSSENRMISVTEDALDEPLFSPVDRLHQPYQPKNGDSDQKDFPPKNFSRHDPSLTESRELPAYTRRGLSLDLSTGNRLSNSSIDEDGKGGFTVSNENKHLHSRPD